MWNPGEVIVGRGIFEGRVWTAISVIVVRDTPRELLMTLLPGTECRVEADYARKDGNRRWDFKYKDWQLAPFQWHTNRVLMLCEPDKFYSIWLFWQGESDTFLGYYVNFQLPFKRVPCGFDTLDLELDLVIDPDFSCHWKDLDDFHRAIEAGIIFPEWVEKIEAARVEVMDRLEKRHYPFDGSWLNWKPDPGWLPPSLPENWDKI